MGYHPGAILAQCPPPQSLKVSGGNGGSGGRGGVGGCPVLPFSPVGTQSPCVSGTCVSFSRLFSLQAVLPTVSKATSLTFQRAHTPYPPPFPSTPQVPTPGLFLPVTAALIREGSVVQQAAIATPCSPVPHGRLAHSCGLNTGRLC